MISKQNWYFCLKQIAALYSLNAGNTTTAFLAVRNLSMFTSTPTPNKLSHIGVLLVKCDERDMTYILRKAIEMEDPLLPDQVPTTRQMLHQETEKD